MKLKEMLTKILPCETVHIAFSSDYVIMGNKSYLLSKMEERDLLAEVLNVYTNEYGHIVIRANLVYYSELKERVTKGLLVKVLSSYYRDKPVIIQTITFSGTFTAKIVQGTSDNPNNKVITGFINPTGFTVEIQTENNEYLDSNIILRVKGEKIDDR